MRSRPVGCATDREVVAAALVAGSAKAAAHRLGLSLSTVKHHLANARSKVGATTTAQLVWILARGCPNRTAQHGRTSSGLLDEAVGLLDLNLRHRPHWHSIVVSLALPGRGRQARSTSSHHDAR